MLRVAIAGTGGIAAVHAAAFAGLPDVRVTAAVNHRPESLARFAAHFGVDRTYLALDDLLADHAADALVVCTPNALHAPQAVAALGAGLHVLVEKPLALSAREGREMVDAAARTGRLLVVAHCWRHDVETRWLRGRVASGAVGQVVRTRGFGVHVGWGPGGWFAVRALAGGGALVDMGVHALDTARFLLGDPAPLRVFARVERRYGHLAGGDVDDTGLVVVDWEGGASSEVECGWWQPHADGPEAATRVYGTEGYASLFPTHLTRGSREGVPETEDPGFPPRAPHCLPAMYEAQAAAFVAAVRGEAAPVAAAHEALAVQRVLDAAYESARTGQVVTLAPVQNP